MRASKPVLRTCSVTPHAFATACAPWTSKPIALFGSVTLADGKYSIGEYSMSTQSLNCPDWRRPAGAGREACVEGDVPIELVPPQAARTSIDPRASRYSCGDRLMRFLLPELRTHLHRGRPHRGRVIP